jgi:CrcB protein
MTPWLVHLVLVGCGGFLGAISRYKLSGFITNRFPSVFPYGTLTVNLLGCLLLGFLMRQHNDALRLLAGVGFMGAFTTFSTLTLESLQLLKQKKALTWFLYTLLSYSFGLLLVCLGYYL